jgi:hypothetical protein
MLKLIRQSEQKNLPDPRECFKLKHYIQMLLVGGVPLGLCILVPVILDPRIWIYAISIVLGGTWYGLVALVVTDRAREQFLEQQHLENEQDPCPNCGYYLVGLPEPKCPECGMVWSPWDPLEDSPSDH